MDPYSKLVKKPLTFKRITGLDLHEFHTIIAKLRPIFQRKYLKKKKIAGRPYAVESIESQLVCLLIYYRVYTTHFFLGLIFNVDPTTICRTIRRIEPLLAKVMRIKKERKMPERELETLIIDCTEQPIRRPQKRQKKFYSGKKRRHTIKTEIVTNQRGKIKQISKPYPGSVHDIKIRKKQKPLPPHAQILVDSGYQGLQNEHEHVRLPIKKTKKNPLTRKSRHSNRQLSRERIIIENKFAQMKIFQILAQTYRNSLASYGVKTAIIAGIVNMKNGF